MTKFKSCNCTLPYETCCGLIERQEAQNGMFRVNEMFQDLYGKQNKLEWNNHSGTTMSPDPGYILKDGTKGKFEGILSSINDLLEYKNAKYGNAALEPLNIFSEFGAIGQRLDDKLARVKNCEELRKNDIVDIIGYLVLLCKEHGWESFDEFKD
tara:strand:+ start:3593 stop:4054 length:462 start_codon:yes stop_codon:yes gene_type:complete